MSDEYICKDCGHRAGDHAVNNRCLNCDCVADPYLEQLVALREQLVELQTDKVELIAQRDTWIGNADALRKQLEVALAELDYLEPRIDEYVKASIIKTLEEINRIGGINE